MNIESILSKVPDYNNFYTVDELDKQIKSLGRKYPEIVKINELGISRKGHKILSMSIGKSSKSALCFACPHPNEPIGAMTLITLGKILAEDSQLLLETNLTWHLIPCIDPDGTRLNEGWFKGPFTLTNYIRNFYRPAGHEQVEWTFPLNYKGISFNKPIPETKVLMKFMDRIKPSFMYSLHNTAFGGAYWYLTDNKPELCSNLEKSAERQNIPLQLGEPEAPYITKFSPAVHSMLSMTEYYDYMEKHTGSLPVGSVPSGSCSSDYIKTVCECISLMAEVPYFSDERISDQSLKEISHRDVVLENIRLSKQHYGFLETNLSKIRDLFKKDNPFPGLVYSCQEYSDINIKAKVNKIRSEEYNKKATTSEWFDNLYGLRYFECLNLALIVRACDYEIEKGNSREINKLNESRTIFNNELTRMCSELEENLDYDVIEIKKLVKVQIESAFNVVNYINNKNGEK